MLRKGFIEIQIEMLAACLAKILFHSNRADDIGGTQEIQRASRKVTGLDLTMLAALTETSLLAQFTDNNGFDAGRSLVIGCLMQEQAEIYDRQELRERAAIFRQKALLLLLSSLLEEPKLRNPDYEERIQALLDQVTYQDLSALGQQKLSAYRTLLNAKIPPGTHPAESSPDHDR
jgi:hypothetical protein